MLKILKRKLIFKLIEEYEKAEIKAFNERKQVFINEGLTAKQISAVEQEIWRITMEAMRELGK